jgi:hypothetical protein
MTLENGNFLTILEAECPRSRCQQEWFLLSPNGQELTQISLLCLQATKFCFLFKGSSTHEFPCILSSPLYKDTITLENGTVWWLHFDLIIRLKDIFCKYSHILRYCVRGIQLSTLWERHNLVQARDENENRYFAIAFI